MPEEWTNTVDLGYLVRRFHTTAEEAVDDAVELVGDKSDRLVPQQTRATRKSQRRGRQGLRGYVSYTDPKAVALHENLTERHRGGRRAKYLEAPLMGSTETIRRRALARFRAVTGG